MKKISFKIWAFFLLFCLIVITSLITIHFYQKYTYKKTNDILSSLGIKNAIDKLPLGSDVSITATNKKNQIYIQIHNLKINLTAPVLNEEIITIFKNYTPYTDLFFFPKESLLIANAEILNFLIKINITYNQKDKNATININIYEPFIGNIEIKTKVENIDDNYLKYLKNMLESLNFNAIYKTISLSSISFSYTPNLFIKNYQKAMDFNQSSKSQNYQQFFEWYQNAQEKLNVNNDIIKNNLQEASIFLKKPEKIAGKILFNPPAPLDAIPALLPAISINTSNK